MPAAPVPAAIPLLVPDLPAPEALMPYLQRMHAARQYSNFGPLVCEFETSLRSRFSAQSPVPLRLTTVANATLGLELALTALDLPPRSRVLLPALTFVATATAVLRAGHLPVLADVDAQSWLLTPEIARQAATQGKVDAVLPVATFGVPHGMAGWHEFELDTGIPVVIDAAAAFGSQWLDAPTGTAVFSLHATKCLPAGEGGFVVSTRPELIARVRQLTNFGINLNPAAGVPVGMLARIGTNAKMSEYHAAVGLASLDHWDARAALRRSAHADLCARLDAAATPALLRWQAMAEPVAAPTLLCVRLPSAKSRERLERVCAERNIMVRRWYQPLLNAMPALDGHSVCLPAPAATSIATDLCGLPFYLGMEEGDAERIAEAVHAATGAQGSAARGERRRSA
ncbi:DegT/DnrJ/EryC1/StrS family aminotransferase [Paracidovorax valerianellae]|nr:DegT/DnrJ/EryC1/StrS family aminotransferase [Paracidovorax valerianellae]